MLGEARTLELRKDDIVKDRPPVRVAGAADEKAAVGVIRMGFGSDPVARWTYPDPENYLSAFPEFIRAFAGKAFECGTAYVAEENKGAALWLPPGVGPDEAELVSILESSTPRSIKKDLFSVLEQMGEFHPAEPHWYLPMIAVDPFRQGQGTGGKLMKFALERCDEEQMPAYLESSNARNISLYQRYGFEIIGLIRSGGSPPMFPMLRKPRPYAY